MRYKRGFTADQNKWYIRLLEIIGVIWALPYTVAGLIFALFCVSMRWCDVARLEWPFLDIVVRKRGGLGGDGFRKLWEGWGALGLFGQVQFYRWDAVNHKKTVRHERFHGYQIMKWGLLWLPAYISHVAFLYFFRKEQNAYYDCFLERQARKFAGQKVDIPRNEWAWGPKIRLPWFGGWPK